MENIHKIWGTRNRLLLTDKTEIDLLYLKANTFCSTHSHKDKINKFYVIEGRVRIETEFGKKELGKDEEFTVRPPLVHRFYALEDSVMSELAYVEEGKIDPKDINRISQGGKDFNGNEMTENEMRDKGLLEL